MSRECEVFRRLWGKALGVAGNEYKSESDDFSDDFSDSFGNTVRVLNCVDGADGADDATLLFLGIVYMIRLDVFIS